MSGLIYADNSLNFCAKRVVSHVKATVTFHSITVVDCAFFLAMLCLNTWWPFQQCLLFCDRMLHRACFWPFVRTVTDTVFGQMEHVPCANVWGTLQGLAVGVEAWENVKVKKQNCKETIFAYFITRVPCFWCSFLLKKVGGWSFGIYSLPWIVCFLLSIFAVGQKNDFRKYLCWRVRDMGTEFPNFWRTCA